VKLKKKIQRAGQDRAQSKEVNGRMALMDTYVQNGV
jgi:hypothetical protein